MKTIWKAFDTSWEVNEEGIVRHIKTHRFLKIRHRKAGSFGKRQTKLDI